VPLVLRRTIAGGLGVRFAHICALFRGSVEAPALDREDGRGHCGTRRRFAVDVKPITN